MRRSCARGARLRHGRPAARIGWVDPASDRPRAVLVIANPVSGGGRARLLAPALCAALQQHGCRAEVHFTTGPGDAMRRAREAAAEPWDALVAAGGDGTVAEVVGGMPSFARPFGMLPIGTANVLAAEYRLPRRPAAIAALIASGRTRDHAVGTAGGRRFVLFCGAGVDGAVVRRLHAVRSGTLGKRKWIGPILHTVQHWPRYALRATLPTGEVLEGLRSVLVTRVRNYGGVLQLVRGIDPQDGLLHVLCFRHTGRLAWMWQGAQAFARVLRPSRRLLVRSTVSVRIDGDAAPFQLDGDFAGETPVDIALEPVPVRLFAPP